MVAATLLDLKVARLLPSAEVDEEDLALLEARDLLFARLLQYRAYKEVAALFAEQMEPARGGSRGRSPLEAAVRRRCCPRSSSASSAAASSPSWRRGPMRRARCRSSMSAHIHAPVVSVREQAVILADAAAADRRGDVPVADRRLPGHDGGRRAVPGAARALPRGRRGVRPGACRWVSCTCAGWPATTSRRSSTADVETPTTRWCADELTS